MSLFCLLWVPLFYFLRKSIIGSGSSGSVWALLLGSITAIIQFFLGDIIMPGGFGLSRWLYGFVDLISLTALIPFFLYFLILLFRGFSQEADFANFALLWLIPFGALRALSWSAGSDPILLVAVPLLWTALAAGMSYFINLMKRKFRWWVVIISILCMLILPVLSAASYWAFFSQQTLFGFALTSAAFVPIIFSFIFERGKN